MGTKECIEFLENAKTAYYTPGDVKRGYWDKIDEVIKRLQMWEEFKEQYKGCYLMVMQSARGLSHLMDEFEKERFPKPKSKRQKINDILEQLNSPDVRTDVKEIKSLLIELRDEGL